MTAQEQVFDNLLLRRLILEKVVYAKYKEELRLFIRKEVDSLIVNSWFKFCSCDICRNYRNIQ